MEDNIALILILYAIGLILSGLLYSFRLGKAGENRLCALLGMALGLPLAYVCAKLFFLLHNIGMDIRNWTVDSALLPQWEEMSFAGGCIGFALGILAAAKIMRVQGRKALNLFAVPGCLLVAFARLAEMGMETIGRGELPAFMPQVFPLALVDDWGDAKLAVFTLAALAALLCALWLAVKGRKPIGYELQFGKACIVLCSIQLFLEMLVDTWIPFIISFIHLDQVICGVILLVTVIRGSVRNKKAGPVIVTVLLIGLNALMQFVQDKPYLVPALNGADIPSLATAVFALCSVGLIAAGMRAFRGRYY